MKHENMSRNFDELKYTKTCCTCGEEFKCGHPSRKYCDKCKKEKSIKGRSESNTEHSYKKRVCSRCNEEFQPSSGNQKYCSECRYEANMERDKERNDKKKEEREEKIYICPCCHEEFTKTGNNQKYCLYCSKIARYRKDAFENFEHKCNVCGVEGTPMTLDVHHKDRDRNNGDLDNLEILCKHCHHMEHIVRDETTGKIIAIQ